MFRPTINALGDDDGAKLLAEANKWRALCTIAGHSSRKAANNCALNGRQEWQEKEAGKGSRKRGA